MRDPFAEDRTSQWGSRVKRALLDLDARLDSGIFHSTLWGREAYERFSAFMDRFHVAGWRRWLGIEPLSEMATFGAGGLVLMLALAIPAFRETSDDDWLKKSELAVTFLDRYGNEIGSRGIRHNDSIPLEDFPDHLIKAVIATKAVADALRIEAGSPIFQIERTSMTTGNQPIDYEVLSYRGDFVRFATKLLRHPGSLAGTPALRSRKR